MKRRNTTLIAIFGVLAVVSILVFGTFEMGESARKDTLDAVHSVSLLYLDELAGRRERVVSHNISEKVDVIHTVLELMEDKEISTIEDLQSYQSQMKRLFNLEKFAFVDTDGTIYTSLGTQDDIDDYDFDPAGLKEADVSIKDLYGKESRHCRSDRSDHHRR